MNTTYANDVNVLIAEHHAGQYPGFLNVAAEFLLRHRATQGFASDEEIAEAAFEEGIGEAEIAAALAIESGEFDLSVDPFGLDWMIK